VLVPIEPTKRSGYCREWVARCRTTSTLRSAACLVTRPAIRLRHILNDDGFICNRISATTADSFNPNCNSIASKAVRSSQAISTIRETSASLSNGMAAFRLRICGNRWLGIHRMAPSAPATHERLAIRVSASRMGNHAATPNLGYTIRSTIKHAHSAAATNQRPADGLSRRAIHAIRLGATPHASNPLDCPAAARITRPQWMAPRKLKMVALYASSAATLRTRSDASENQTAKTSPTKGIRPAYPSPSAHWLGPLCAVAVMVVFCRVEIVAYRIGHGRQRTTVNGPAHLLSIPLLPTPAASLRVNDAGARSTTARVVLHKNLR